MARASEEFCCAVIEATGEFAVAVKPQIAFFEVFGAFGIESYFRIVRFAQKQGLLVVGDIKRADIGSTAAAYAKAFLGGGEDGNSPVLDSITVNPWFGTDGVQPFIEMATSRGCGIFVLVRTSNPSSMELQGLEVGGKTISAHTAALATEWNRGFVEDDGYGPVGAVVGATHPDELAVLRQALPHSWILIPGVGAQGADMEDVVAGFDSHGSGALVSLSRGITYPWGGNVAPPNWVEEIAASAKKWNTDLNHVRAGIRST